MAERTSHPHATISWADLATSDQDAAKAFYADLFCWEYDDQDVGESVTYSLAKRLRAEGRGEHVGKFRAVG